ncbi:DNA polymerase III subunit gamma/tau [Caldibacillus debilis]|uniref:DNA polymerase III subunit gamma/tau n=1 Tax=Caldibacillus debilis TaxID=301148 RepID=UPI0003704F8D|nr:DNA polymerase III subunit gamma/tau [Caldibacillus debilis]
MSYQALYRVWRPQTFADIIGQEHVTKTLQNALLQQKISHAYLFSGPRGTGKTTAAKVLAKTVNCLKAPVSEPCNECEICKGIADGSVTDVIEIDAASNNSVEEIRDIREKVKYAPARAKYKVYIIDEVHMLSQGAFNALLKTLEEPPNHVIFILATTEPHKIPLTIVSRCQRFDFKRILPNMIAERLRHILETEGIGYEEEALRVIARSAGGGLRDALSLLDQAISYSGGKLTVEDALTVTGSVSQQALFDLARAIRQRDAGQALEAVHVMLFQGKEPARIVEECIQFYRDLLLYKTSPRLSEYFERITMSDVLDRLAGEAEEEEIYQIVEELSRFQQEMKWSGQPSVLLEVCVVKLCQIPEKANAGEFLEKISYLEDKIARLEAELQEIKEKGAAAPSEAEEGAKNGSSKKPGNGLTRKPNGSKVPLGKIESILANATKQQLTFFKNHWEAVLKKVKNKSCAALLNDAEPVAASKDKCIIKFKYDLHCEMVMSNGEYINEINFALTSVSGSPVEMVGIPENQWKAVRRSYIENHIYGHRETPNEEKDPLIEEAKKLVGEDLLEIID